MRVLVGPLEKQEMRDSGFFYGIAGLPERDRREIPGCGRDGIGGNFAASYDLAYN